MIDDCQLAETILLRYLCQALSVGVLDEALNVDCLYDCRRDLDGILLEYVCVYMRISRMIFGQ